MFIHIVYAVFLYVRRICKSFMANVSRKTWLKRNYVVLDTVCKYTHPSITTVRVARNEVLNKIRKQYLVIDIPAIDLLFSSGVFQFRIQIRYNSNFVPAVCESKMCYSCLLHFQIYLDFVNNKVYILRARVIIVLTCPLMFLQHRHTRKGSEVILLSILPNFAIFI